MTEQGTDWLGAEYKRTDHDFTFRHLQQDNCCCSVCHGTGAKWEFGYVTRNYQSPRTKKICKTLQAHGHSFWICQRCLDNMKAIAGLTISVERVEDACMDAATRTVQGRCRMTLSFDAGNNFEIYVMTLCEEIKPKTEKDLEDLAEELHQRIEIAVEDFINESDKFDIENYNGMY